MYIYSKPEVKAIVEINKLVKGRHAGKDVMSTLLLKNRLPVMTIIISYRMGSMTVLDDYVT